MRALNPLVEVVEHRERLMAANAFRLIDDYDVIVNGVDNFPARFLINDACVMHRKLLVDGGVLQFVGYAMTIKGGETACYRCLFPVFIDPGDAQCATEEGVFGPVTDRHRSGHGSDQADHRDRRAALQQDAHV